MNMPVKDESTPLLPHPRPALKSSTPASPPACTPNSETEKPHRQLTTSSPEHNHTSEDGGWIAIFSGDLGHFGLVQYLALIVLFDLDLNKMDSAHPPNIQSSLIRFHATMILLMVFFLNYKNRQRWIRRSVPLNSESRIQQERYEWAKKSFVRVTRILGYTLFFTVFEEVGIAVYLLYLDWINSAWKSIGFVVELLLVLLLGAASFYWGIPIVKFEVEGPKLAGGDRDIEGGQPASSHSSSEP